MIAGHSLGAGVASLAAPWAALQWPSADVRCVTFGNPKPGNAAFARVRLLAVSSAGLLCSCVLCRGWSVESCCVVGCSVVAGRPSCLMARPEGSFLSGVFLLTLGLLPSSADQYSLGILSEAPHPHSKACVERLLLV